MRKAAGKSVSLVLVYETKLWFMPRLYSGCHKLGVDESCVGYFGHKSIRLCHVASSFQDYTTLAFVHISLHFLQPLEIV